MHRLPHPVEGFPPTTGTVRVVQHPHESVPRREVVFKHLPTGKLYATQPGTDAARELRRSDPHSWEQVPTFHTQQKETQDADTQAAPGSPPERL